MYNTLNPIILVGKIFTRVYQNDQEELHFENDSEHYKFYHSQDCCESVSIDEVVGDLDDLVGVPILGFEEPSTDDLLQKDKYDDSHTWTYYKFRTIKGYVDVKWYGTSNGYYSESVDFEKV
jgi:hypothetical protein